MLTKELSKCTWRIIYDEIQYLGRIVADSLPTYDGSPPMLNLSDAAMEDIEEQMLALKVALNKYLNTKKIMPFKPKWRYSIRDKSTWFSSTEFQYGHLSSLHKPIHLCLHQEDHL